MLARRLALGLWAGLLIYQGALFAPLLFAQLPDRLAAGRLAGDGFTIAGYLSLAFALLLVALRPRTVAGQRRLAAWTLAPALMLLISHTVLRPWMAAARSSGPGGAPGPEFGALHGAASALYVLAAVLVIGLWVREERQATR